VNEPFDDDVAIGKTGAASEPRRFLSQRAFWHSLGLLLALAIAWLVFRSYRQPGFLVDFANMQWC
jgi:hypothetical protein